MSTSTHLSLDYVSGRPRVADYREIVAEFESGTTNISALARQFNVDRHTIRRALRAGGGDNVPVAKLLATAPAGCTDPVVLGYTGGAKIRDICEKNDIGRSTVYRRLAAAGVQVRRLNGRIVLPESEEDSAA